ncbi:MAG: hypothetical protein ACK4GC_08085, partial [Paracoccaceae bacterium]
LRLDATAVEARLIGSAILVALVANGFGRMSLAVLAGPVRFWLPLLISTLAAAVVGATAFILLAMDA